MSLMAPDGLPRVLVMLGSYNGEAFIAQQIDSILAQEDVEVTLAIADDGSQDATCALCRDYAAKDSRVIFRENQRNKGVARNYMDMVCEADADAYEFFAFSDQDDYWLPNKLAEAIKMLRASRFSSEDDEQVPLLYYSDIHNVSEDLQEERQQEPDFSSCAQNLRSLLLLNWASGCTMVFNRALCKLLQAHPLEDYPRIHDSWVHLVALSCGKTVPDLQHAYIQRRIWGGNVVGETDHGKVGIGRILQMFRTVMLESTHLQTRTARCLMEEFGDIMPAEAARDVQDILALEHSFIARVKLCLHPRCTLPSKKELAILRIRALCGRL